MRPMSLTISGCSPATPTSYAAGLAGLDDVAVDLLLGLVDDLLDAPRVDAPVRHELLEGEARDLAAHRLVGAHHHRVGRVVDDHVDAGGELERADVAPLAPDDAPLHLVVRQRHARHGRLGRVLGGDALHGERDDLLRLAVRVAARRLADLAHAVGRIGLRLLLHPTHQLRAGLVGREAGELLEALRRLGLEPRDAGLAVGEHRLALLQLARPARQVALALLEPLVRRSSWPPRSWRRRSSRSISSRRRRASVSCASRAWSNSSRPATTAAFRSPSASRSASPTVRRPCCSASDTSRRACCSASVTRRRPRSSASPTMRRPVSSPWPGRHAASRARRRGRQPRRRRAPRCGPKRILRSRARRRAPRRARG
jgi:hypothetical protein